MNAYKFRLMPNQLQQNKLDQMFGNSRFIWNYFLNLNNTIYEESKKNKTKSKHLTSFDCSKILIELKNEYPFLKESNAQSLQQTLKDLDTTYTRFFKKQADYPNFKTKKKSKQSFRIPQGIKIKDDRLYIFKFQEGIKVIFDNREIEGNIKSATISKTKTGKYFVSILTDANIHKVRISDNQVGLDLGIKDFVVTSNGEKFNLLEKKDKGKLKYLHRQLSKKEKGSNNKEKARQKLSLEYERIRNIKEDFQHKLADKLCKENELIAIEDLNIKGMVKNHKLAESISDQSWSSFIIKLQYKAERYGTKIEKVNRFYASSKTCSQCGYVNKNLTLKDREWTCPSCGAKLDRDINAAKNILAEVKGCRDYSLKSVELPLQFGAVKQKVPGYLLGIQGQSMEDNWSDDIGIKWKPKPGTEAEKLKEELKFFKIGGQFYV